MSKKRRVFKLFEKIIKIVLKYLPKKFWNTFNLALSFFSNPSIGSPIKFYNSDHSLTLKEYNMADMPKDIHDRCLDFCYPDDMPDRDKEKAIDEKHYWQHSLIFLIFTKTGDIVGSAIYLIHDNGVTLPILNSYIISDNGEREKFPENRWDIKNHTYVEIYRLRRSIKHRSLAIPITDMLFRAVWAKSIQSNTDFLICSCNDEFNHVKRIYRKRLIFDDAGFMVRYDNCDIDWVVFRKDCLKHDRTFASKSTDHFFRQLYFRKNLRQITCGKPNIFISILLKLRFAISTLWENTFKNGSHEKNKTREVSYV